MAQQQRVGLYVNNADSYAMFNLQTGPQLLDRIEALLPEHRERLFPPTETLSMFVAQVLSTHGTAVATPGWSTMPWSSDSSAD